MKEKIIDYKKDDLTVHWKPARCIHSEKCWRGLPAVFKPKEKPWVQTDSTDADTIMQQIDQCPSGALSYTLKGDPEEKNPDSIKCEIIKDGPILVKGTIQLTGADGKVEEVSNPALCRCGASSNKPFCDGTHNKIDFSG